MSISKSHGHRRSVVADQSKLCPEGGIWETRAKDCAFRLGSYTPVSGASRTWTLVSTRGKECGIRSGERGRLCSSLGPE